jgi:hypothetical protein
MPSISARAVAPGQELATRNREIGDQIRVHWAHDEGGSIAVALIHRVVREAVTV